jgi:lipopolysaccharide/colanic/teichoic acid biosynthesis glycosyltransferase
MIRALDILFSIFFIIILSPLLLILAALITLTTGWPFVFRQSRVGLHGKNFQIIKFRTMRKNAEKFGQLTVGERDPRITPIGYFIRKYKLDELPQFWNVLVGEMSIVGPRPEVRKYVTLYNKQQLKVLSVRPGITDDATIRFRNENLIIGRYDSPEEAYINEILPYKLRLSGIWLKNPTLKNYFRIIWQTFLALFHTKKR